MYLKGLYADKPALYKLFLLLLFMVIGAIFFTLLATGLIYGIFGIQTDFMQHPDMVRIVQLFSAVGTFLFPAFALAWVGSTHPREFLSIGPVPHVKLLVLTALSIFLSQWEESGHVPSGYNAAVLTAAEGRFDDAIDLLSSVMEADESGDARELYRAMMAVRASDEQAEMQISGESSAAADAASDGNAVYDIVMRR